MPSAAAMNIVNRFAWGSNVLRDGRMIGEQYVVAEAIDRALAEKDAEISRLKTQLPPDVRRLVVAARIVAFEDNGLKAIKELDQASEAFAERVPWRDEPRASGE